jgi:hypothetical protein
VFDVPDTVGQTATPPASCVGPLAATTLTRSVSAPVVAPALAATPATVPAATAAAATASLTSASTGTAATSSSVGTVYGPTTPYFTPAFRHLHGDSDDDNDMPSILKEFQDIPKLEADGKGWRLFEARCTFAARSLRLGPVLEKETVWSSDNDKKIKQENAATQLLNAIVQKLPGPLLCKYMTVQQPHELWAGLKSEFGQANVATTAAIEAQMFGLSCAPKGNMRTYLDTMLEYQQQLIEADSSLTDERFQDTIIVGARSAGPAYIAIIEALVQSYHVATLTAVAGTRLQSSSPRSARRTTRPLAQSSSPRRLSDRRTVLLSAEAGGVTLAIGAAVAAEAKAALRRRIATRRLAHASASAAAASDT